MKAYLRFDPLTDERKAGYTDAQFRAFFNVLCAAARQSPRGRFRNAAQLRGLLGRHARHVAFLVTEGDLRSMADGTIYVDGWDQWQEGDLSVADRMAALRNRKGNGATRSPGAERTANWRLRNDVFERDLHTCRYCGIADYQRDWLVAEHVIPDGPSTLENLVTACRPCNKRKGPRTPAQAGMPLLPVPNGDALRDASHTSVA